VRRSSHRKEYTNRAQWAAKFASVAEGVDTPEANLKAKETRAKLVAHKANHDSLESACVQYAALQKVKLLKVDAESHFSKFGRLQANRVTTGIPDRIAVMPPTGRFAGFEFKTGNACLRKNQKALHKTLSDGGGAMFVIKSVDQFIAVFEGLLQIEQEKYDVILRSEQHTPRCLAISDSTETGGQS
jgi:hypothetical protein